MDVQGNALGRIAHQLQSPGWTYGGADPAAHALGGIQDQVLTVKVQGRELTMLDAQAAVSAPLVVNGAHVSRRREHGDAVALSLHGPAAAGTAVADGVEATQHGVFEKGMVHVAALLLGLEDVHGLLLGDAPGPCGMVLGDKPRKRFSHDETDIHGQAGLVAGSPARAFQNRDMVWTLYDDIPGHGIGNHLFQVTKVDVAIDGDQFLGVFQGQDLAVIAIGKGNFSRSAADVIGGIRRTFEKPIEGFEQTGQGMGPGSHGNIQIGPSTVHIPMHQVPQGKPRSGLGLLGNAN